MSAVLESFLRKPGQPEGTFTPGELEGFLFAVASAPDLVSPSEWIPVVFDDGEPAFASEAEAESVLAALVERYDALSDFVRGGAGTLPPGCAFRDDLLANFEPDAPVAQWARGFMGGHVWLEETWEDVLPEEWEDELAAVTVTLAFFASREFALSYLADSGKSADDLPEAAALFKDAFGDAVAVYAGMGTELWAALQEMDAEDGDGGEEA